MKLWQIGLIIFLIAGALNAIFINLNLGGLPRELARLSILIGFVLLVMGLLRRKK